MFSVILVPLDGRDGRGQALPLALSLANRAKPLFTLSMWAGSAKKEEHADQDYLDGIVAQFEHRYRGRSSGRARRTGRRHARRPQPIGGRGLDCDDDAWPRALSRLFVGSVADDVIRRLAGAGTRVEADGSFSIPLTRSGVRSMSSSPWMHRLFPKRRLPPRKRSPKLDERRTSRCCHRRADPRPDARRRARAAGHGRCDAARRDLGPGRGPTSSGSRPDCGRRTSRPLGRSLSMTVRRRRFSTSARTSIYSSWRRTRTPDCRALFGQRGRRSGPRGGQTGARRPSPRSTAGGIDHGRGVLKSSRVGSHDREGRRGSRDHAAQGRYVDLDRARVLRRR